MLERIPPPVSLKLSVVVVIVGFLTPFLCKFDDIADKLKNVALFTGLQEQGKQPNLTPNFPYSFCYVEENSEIVLAVMNEKSACISSVDWIRGQLFPKVVKWAETAGTEDKSNRFVTSSLNLVNIVKYNKLYQQLKKKYGLQMVQVKQICFYWC